VQLEGLIDLIPPRVLDSAHVFGPADCSGLCLYMGNRHIQYRDLFSGFPLFQGLYHDKRVKMRVCRRPDTLNVLAPSKTAYGMLL
jgi:hypothetical protein